MQTSTDRYAYFLRYHLLVQNGYAPWFAAEIAEAGDELTARSLRGARVLQQRSELKRVLAQGGGAR